MPGTTEIVSLDGHTYIYFLPVSLAKAQELAMLALGCQGASASTWGGHDTDAYVSVVLSSNYWFDERLHSQTITDTLVAIWNGFVAMKAVTGPMPQPSAGNPRAMLPT
ncbi:hypothetical protein H7142_03235 [Candidatus Saccharibacteria bacterium]|nr:hypothetical protein [Candidatus Saccharibacteria bacterium]